jgi:putative ATP-dependent endonuclease of the OLD family
VRSRDVAPPEQWTMSTAAVAAAAPAIYRLSIERFRGVVSLVWQPTRGVNLILGGGDVGKTTILDAIGLLLSPVNTSNVSDTDYYERKIEAGFVIEAVMSLPPGSGISNQLKASWPWEWTGDDLTIPRMEDDGGQTGEPVYRLRVRGTEDLELSHEIVQPDASVDPFPVGLRRSIGLVRLGGDDRNDRDLRLVQGSALDRLLSDRGFARDWRASSPRAM